MKGYRFYEEFTNTRKRVSQGNIVAVLLDERGHEYVSGSGMLDATAAVFDRPDSPTAGTSVQRAYLRKKCKRVNEARARGVHPSLFAWLDSFEETDG